MTPQVQQPMTVPEATAIIRRHIDNDLGDDTLLGWLRPYRGVEQRHLVELLEALWVLAPSLSESAIVDRVVVHDFWELCRSARNWTRGPHEPMFHGRLFIAPADKSRLDSWIDEIESITLKLLAGLPPATAFGGMAWYAVAWGLGPQAAFLVPLFRESLPEYLADGCVDDTIYVCQALGAIGPAARGAVPLLIEVRDTSGNAEARAAASAAIRALGS